MFLALYTKPVDEIELELVSALEQQRKIFSYRSSPESKVEDLSLAFHDLNDKTRDFIRITQRRIAELENIIEKDEEFKWVH